MAQTQPVTQPMPAPAQPAPVQPTSPAQKPHVEKGHGARNFFLYAFMFVLLYMVAINLGGILFDLIEKFLPAYGTTPTVRYSQSALRYFLASTIIGAPIFLYIVYKVNKMIKTDLNLRDSVLRKWLTYLTLLASALTAIGRLIYVVWAFLGGEVSASILLKTVVILIIAGGIFFYYFRELKFTKAQQAGVVMEFAGFQKAFFIGSAIVILLTLIGGLFIIESPFQQRMRKRDEARISDLNRITSSVSRHVSANNKLPTSLSDADVLEDYNKDPQTNQPYEYKILTATSYQLCAVFETSNKEGDVGSYGYYNDSYLHNAERTCFTKTVKLNSTTGSGGVRLEFPEDFADFEETY